MSVARQTLIERIKFFRLAISDPLLVAKTPSDVDHNGRARLLRNGLAVVGFALIEDFIKSRTKEILEKASAAPVRFDDLPPRLKEACTYNVVGALKKQSEDRRRNKEDFIGYIQAAAKSLASTSGSGYQLSSLAFGHEKSNINAADIADILLSFQVEDPWRNIDAFAKRVGLAAPSYKDAFTNLAKDRHKAAHKADADIDVLDLQNVPNNAIGIAISFDALISKALSNILSAEVDFLKGDKKVNQGDIGIRYVDQDSTMVWKVKDEGAKRATIAGVDPDELFNRSISLARAKKQIIVKRTIRKIPEYWLPSE